MSRFSSAKISDDLFLVIDQNFLIFTLFSLLHCFLKANCVPFPLIFLIVFPFYYFSRPGPRGSVPLTPLIGPVILSRTLPSSLFLSSISLPVCLCVCLSVSLSMQSFCLRIRPQVVSRNEA